MTRLAKSPMPKHRGDQPVCFRARNRHLFFEGEPMRSLLASPPVGYSPPWGKRQRAWRRWSDRDLFRREFHRLFNTNRLHEFGPQQ